MSQKSWSAHQSSNVSQIKFRPSSIPLLRGWGAGFNSGTCATILALVFSFPAWADITEKVVGVADGDTITVLDADRVQHKIRLTGIDAPEKRQPFGNRSKQSLSDMVFDKTVTVETDKLDRYGRELGKVLAGGKDVNLEQVRAGMAWHYKAYERTQSATDRQSLLRRRERSQSR